jgi:hypothetical protein
MKRLLIGVVTVAALLGMKFYNKASAHDKVRARLVELCEGEAQCLAAVETHFDSCFEQSYKMGGRHRSASLNFDAFVSCMNSRAGKPYFQVDEEE